MIRYKIDISQKECDALIEMQLKHSVSRGIQNFFRIVMAILAIALLYCTFFLRQTTESKILGIVSAAFFLWFAAVGMIAYQKFLLKKVQNKLDKRATFGEREYGFDQDGVIVWTDFSYSELQWEAFKNWGIFKDYIYLIYEMSVDGDARYVTHINLDESIPAHGEGKIKLPVSVPDKGKCYLRVILLSEKWHTAYAAGYVTGI